MAASGRLQKYLQAIDADWYRSRFLALVFIVLAAFSLLSIQLLHLQIVKGSMYRQLSQDNCIRKKRVKAFRGLIYDRQGRILVENRPSFNLMMVEKDAEPLEETVHRLAAFINPEPSAILEKLQNDSGGLYDPVLILEDMDRDTMAAIAAHRFELPGVSIEARARRHYLYPETAAHLLGYMGEVSAGELRSKTFRNKQKGDYVGRSGVEKTFEEALSGRAGGRVVQVNAAGQVVAVLDKVAPEPGDNLFLTIDLALQKKANSLMKGKVGAVVAMEPDTGDVLAMVSRPSFNPNCFVEGMSSEQWQALTGDPDRPLMNKVVQGEYPPASTYKIVTALAALEENEVDPAEQVYCPGHYRYGNRIYYCWKRYGHGRLALVQAIAQSCDVFFYHMGKRLGVDKMAGYAKACGFGSPTGIPLGREEDGLVPTKEWKRQRFGVDWQAGESLSVAIGQGYNLLTPIQMAALISAVANGGVKYQPRILKSIETVEGKTVSKGEPIISGRLPASEKTLKILRKGLWRAVNARHGTAYWHVRDREIQISGKTGTAQVISRKRGEERAEEIPDKYKPHAWFVGYAPSGNPQIAVAVLVEHGEHGSSGAGPIAGELMTTYLGSTESVEKE